MTRQGGKRILLVVDFEGGINKKCVLFRFRNRLMSERERRGKRREEMRGRKRET